VKTIKRISLSLLLFLIGCGQPPEPVQTGIIDPALQPYWEQYVKDKSFYTKANPVTTKKIDIVFYTLSNQGFDGMCTKISNGYRRIQIDPGAWFWSTETDRILLFYHEMGHCDLDLDHTDGLTIMNSDYTPSADFLTNKDYYLDLLFNKGL
jgi:hypothetical protein